MFDPKSGTTPAFDPNKPFKKVSGGNGVPAFDPNKPFKKKEEAGTEPSQQTSGTGGEAGANVPLLQTPSQFAQLRNPAEAQQAEQPIQGTEGAAPVTQEPAPITIDFNNQDPVGSAIFPLTYQKNQILQRNIGADNTAAKSIFVDLFNKEGKILSPKETELADIDKKVASVVSGAFANPDEAKQFLTQQLGKKSFTVQMGNALQPSEEPVNNQNIDQVPLEDIKSAVDAGNQTEKIAYEKYQRNRNIDEALKSPTLDEGLIKYAMSQNKQLADQVEMMGGVTDALPNAFVGNIVANGLYSPEMIQKIKDNPELIKKWKETEANLYTNYPDYAKTRVANIISQAREDRGLNSAIVNIPRAEATDKLVDDLITEGKLGERDRAVYMQQIRPQLGFWNSFGRGIGKTVVPALINDAPIATPGLFETAQDSYVHTLRGVASSIEGIGESQTPYPIVDKARQLNNLLQHDYTQVSVDPKGFWNNLSSSTGTITGFVLPMILGGEVGQAAGLGRNVSAMMTNGLMFGGQNQETALKDYPKDTNKQYLYTTLATTGDMMLGELIPTKETADAARKLFKDKVVNVIEQFTDNKITQAEARQTLLKTAQDIVGETGKGSLKMGSIMTGFNLFHNGLDAAFGGRDVTFDQVANDAVNTFKTGFLGGIAMSALPAIANRPLPQEAKIIREMSKNPAFFEKVINDGAALDPTLEASKNERIQNLNEAAKITNELDQTDLSEKKKTQYLVTALQQKVWERKAEGTTDDVLKKNYEQKAADLSKQKEKIYSGELPEAAKPAEPVHTEQLQQIKTANDQWKQNITAIDERTDVTPEEKVTLKDQEDQRHAQAIADITNQKFAPKPATTTVEKTPEPNIAESIPGNIGEMVQRGQITPDQALLEVAKQKYGVSDNGEPFGTGREMPGLNTDVLDEVTQKYPDQQTVIDAIKTKTNEEAQKTEAQVLGQPNEGAGTGTGTAGTGPEGKTAPLSAKPKLFEKPDGEYPVHEVTIGDKKFYMQKSEGMGGAHDSAWYEVAKDERGHWNRVGDTQALHGKGWMAGHLADTKAEAIDTLLKREQSKVTETKPIEKPPAELPPVETTPSDQPVETISDQQYNDFLDNGEVDQSVLEGIKEKIKTNEQLTEREMSIAADKMGEINDQLVEEQGKDKKTWADSLRNWADNVENFDITGSGGGAAMTNLFKVPQAIIASTMRAVAAALDAGAAIGDAIKAGLAHLKAAGYDEQAEDKDGEFNRVAHDILVGRAPRMNIPTDLTAEKDALLPKDNPAEIQIKTGTDWKNKFSNFFIKNLNELKENSPEGKNAAVKLAATKAQMQTIMRSAAPKIIKLLGTGGWEKLSKAIVQSRLNGIRERWNNMAVNAMNIPNADVMDAYKNGLQNLLKTYSNHYPELMAEENSQAALARGDIDGFKQLAALYFHDAAANVQNVQFGETSYDEIIGHPNFNKALDVYKQYVEKPIADIHAEREGKFSDALGDLKTYYPLIGVVKDGHIYMQKAKEYGKTIDTNSFFASGLSPQGYDTSVEKFTQKLSSFLKSANKNELMDTLKDNGLIKVTTKPTDIEGEKYLVINGEAQPADVLIVNPAREVDGKQIPPTYAVVPKWLAKELKPILENKEFDRNAAVRLLDGTTTFALGSPFEFSLHFANLMGTLVTGTPFADTTLLGKAASINMLTKFLYNAATIWSEKLPEEDLLQMAKEGLISNRYASMTTNKEFAEAMGERDTKKGTGTELVKPYNIFKIFGVGLFGRTGVDIKARHRMWRLHNEMFPDKVIKQIPSKEGEIKAVEEQIKTLKASGAKKVQIQPAEVQLTKLTKELAALNKKHAASVEDRRNFVNQLGNYVWAAQGDLERMLKRTGLTPFYTAGSTMLRNGVNAWLGTSPLSKSGDTLSDNIPINKALAYKVGMQLSTGLIGTVGTWAAMYYFMTGRTPDKDKNARLFEIPVPEGWKNSNMVRTLFYHNGQWSNIGMGFANPLMIRGARTLGIRGAYNTMKAGGTIGQMIEHGEMDMINSVISPVSTSPEVAFGMTAIMGNALYIHSMRDTYGNPHPQLYQTVKKVPAGLQQAANLGQAVINLNPLAVRLLEGIAPSYNMAPDYKHGAEDTRLQKVLTSVFEMAVPRLLTPPHNTAAEERRLIKEEKMTNKK